MLSRCSLGEWTNPCVFAGSRSWFSRRLRVPQHTQVCVTGHKSKWLICHGTSLLSHFIFQLVLINPSLLMTYSLWSFTHPSARWSRSLWLAWCSMTSCQTAATWTPASIRGWRPLGESSLGEPRGSWGLRKEEVSSHLESIPPAKPVERQGQFSNTIEMKEMTPNHTRVIG